MPFNAETYYMNRHRRQAWKQLEAAREIKARVVAGTAYDWEAPRIAFYVQQARGSMRLYLICRSIKGEAP